MQGLAAISHRTSSLYAAAFLLSHDLPLVDVVRDSGGRAEFLIGGRADRVEDLLRDYRSGSALVGARRFGDELRRLKGLIHGHD